MEEKVIGANTWDYAYDNENRMTEFDDPVDSSNNSEYTYDALGRRIRKVVDVDGTPVTTKYFHDGVDVIADYNGSNTLSATYLTPLLDENCIMTIPGSPDETYYYYHDGLGSVRNIYDANETSKNSYDYYAFGKELNWSEDQNVPNRYTYTGREWDSESQTYYYRARQYDQAVGRFTGRDANVSINLYSYVGNMATIAIDPMGLEWKLNRVESKGQNRAVVWSTDTNDKFEKLAKKIHLDPSEYHKWLRYVEDPKRDKHGAPVKEGDTVKQGSKDGCYYTVPNVIFMGMGSFKGIERVQQNMMTYIGGVKDTYEAYGFKVISSDIPPTENWYTVTSADMKKALKNKDLHGFWFAGHGTRQFYYEGVNDRWFGKQNYFVGLGKAGIVGAGGPGDELWDTTSPENYKLSFLYLYACHTADTINGYWVPGVFFDFYGYETNKKQGPHFSDWVAEKDRFTGKEGPSRGSGAGIGPGGYEDD